MTGSSDEQNLVTIVNSDVVSKMGSWSVSVMAQVYEALGRRYVCVYI